VLRKAIVACIAAAFARKTEDNRGTSGQPLPTSAVPPRQPQTANKAFLF